MKIEKSKLILGLALALVAGVSLGYVIKPTPKAPGVSGDFRSLGLDQMRERYIAERDYAIEQAEAAGLYDCCIEPACTMCFDHGIGHQWSLNGQYCSCDELLAEGKDVCPQCKAGLAEGKGE